jgi:glutathione S-transferase
MAARRLLQIPFSHNCIKVRRALDLKGLGYETLDINPAVRRPVVKASRQPLVPVLLDGGRPIAGSTDIVVYLEEAYPQPALLPDDPGDRAECRVLIDWADATFMELTRRLAYSSVLSRPGDLGNLFFPGKPAALRAVAGRIAALILRVRFRISKKSDSRDIPAAKKAAELALQRLGGRGCLVADRLTLADVTLAAMAAPLQYAPAAARNDPGIQELLAWSGTILEADFDPVAARETVAEVS